MSEVETKYDKYNIERDVLHEYVDYYFSHVFFNSVLNLPEEERAAQSIANILRYGAKVEEGETGAGIESLETPPTETPAAGEEETPPAEETPPV